MPRKSLHHPLSFLSKELELCIQKGNTVDLNIEIRSGTEALCGLMEVSVRNCLVVSLVICIGIYVSHVAVQSLAVYGEGGRIKYMERTVYQFCRSLINSFLCALCNRFTKVSQDNRTGSDIAGPVSVDCFTVLLRSP